MSSESESFDRFVGIVRRLRAPDGCPWDREQTPKSIRSNLIEESYECVEAINENAPAHIQEELGDVLLVVAMMATMYDETGAFSIAAVLDGISDKLVRRHPHVFGNAKAGDAEAVLKQWNDIKVTVEGRPKKDSLLDEVPRALPPLERAYKTQKKAAKVGFEWTTATDVWAKLREEIDEAQEACTALAANAATDQAAADHLEDELGDILFSAINITRYLHVDPAVALDRAVAKFSRRFRYVEKEMKARDIPMSRDSFALMDGLWDEAKARERGSGGAGRGETATTVDGRQVRN